MAKKNLHTNRLIQQKSPYLLQHAHNPVDWYPWGDEAFSAASAQDKPIFLSIGYATCHWCHVMEKETFENEEIAQLLNQHFINIKVDREELPEVDSLYMEFAQTMMAGAAGWPLNLMLMPRRLEPFFAATYLPAYTTGNQMGLQDVIQQIVMIWRSPEREVLELHAHRIVEVFAENIHERGAQLPPKELFSLTAEHLFRLADPVYGGIRGAPKFPIPYQNSFMLRYSAVQKDSRALFLISKTIEMILRGGLFDQLGGGISRYSVDEKWHIPHFEKMLYDNALFAEACIELWQLSKSAIGLRGCHATLQYILRDMQQSEGGFFSAEDADSEGKEGAFYTWTPSEIANHLPHEEAELFCRYYNITPQGNFEGRNVLFAKESLQEFAALYQLDEEEFGHSLERDKDLLFRIREGRPHPFKDDKILTAWNGLTIYSFATAAAAFSMPLYKKAAEDAASFIYENMWQNGQLARRWRDGSALFRANLEEYAFLIRGLLRLFEIGSASKWLAWAIELTEILEKQFKAESGAFYESDGSDRSLLLRKCSYTDGAEPSGNAIHCENLLRLYGMTFDNSYRAAAEDILKAVWHFAENYPPGYIYHAMNVQRYYDKNAPTIIVALGKKREYFADIRQALFGKFLPSANIVWKEEGDKLLVESAPNMAQYQAQKEATTLYICRQGRCDKPVTGLHGILQAIQQL
jgi:uncharacterized protein YyaL (SSP411 family)